MELHPSAALLTLVPTAQGSAVDVTGKEERVVLCNMRYVARDAQT